jgi:hypothetical protein
VAAEYAVKVNGSANKELAAAAQIEVYERLGEPTTFRLRYDVDIADGDIPLLGDGRLGPGSGIQILAVLDGQTDCLVKGPVHGQQIHVRHGGAGSWLEAIGSDTSITMDREVRSEIWSGSDSDAVRAILAPYGLRPDIQESSARHVEAKHVLAQRDSDLRFVRRLARRNGYLFWVTADGKGVQTGHFRRAPLDGSAVAKLAINLASPNVETLDLYWDVERPTSSEGLQLNLSDKSVLDGAVAASPQRALGSQSLATIAGATRTVHVVAPCDDVGDLHARGEGALVEADFFLRVACSTSLLALGKILHAHTIVDLQGLGKRHSGKYLVSSVRHLIDPASHRMDLELLRNGWGS